MLLYYVFSNSFSHLCSLFKIAKKILKKAPLQNKKYKTNENGNFVYEAGRNGYVLNTKVTQQGLKPPRASKQINHII